MNGQNRNRLTDTGNRLMVARAEGGWGVKTVKGLSTSGWLQNSHGDVKYSTGNTVNNIVITMYGVRWVLDLLG